MADSERLRQIEARLARIEGALRALEPSSALPSQVPALPEIITPRERVQPVHLEVRETPAPPPPTEPLPPPTRAPAANPHRAPSKHGAEGVELNIGLKYVGWAGALVLAVGVGLALLFAWQSGWFALVSDRLKALGMATLGLLLLGAGEAVYRKVNRLTATGFYGAGIAVLVIAAYAGCEIYGLYPSDVAFSMMGAAVALGMLVSWRGNFLSVALLALFSGFLAPLLLSTGQRPALPLLVYGFLLEVMGLGAAQLCNTPKWTLARASVLGINALWGLLVFGADVTPPTHALIAVAVMTALFQADAILAAVRAEPPAKNKPDDAAAAAARITEAVLSMAATALLCFAGLLAFSAEPRSFKVAWVLALFVVAGIEVWMSGGGGRAQNALHAGFRAQQALLLITLVPVALDGFWWTAGWSALGLGLIQYSIRVRSLPTRVFGVVALILGLLKWAAWDTFQWMGAAPMLSDQHGGYKPAVFNEYGATTAALLAICLAALWTVGRSGAGRDGNRDAEREPEAGNPQLAFVFGVCAAGVLWWFGTVEVVRWLNVLRETRGLDARLPHMGMSLFWSGYAIALIVFGFIVRRSSARVIGLGLFLVTLVKVGLLDLSFLSGGYRIVSVFVLGILLLLTSVLYGIFAPRVMKTLEREV